MKWYHIIPLWASLACVSCTSEQEVPQGREATAGIEFKVSRRVEEGNVTPTTEQLTRLFVAHRAQEQEVTEDGKVLQCGKKDRHDLTAGGEKMEFSLKNLTAQWYKFAFLCVPDLPAQGNIPPVKGSLLYTEENPADETSDFNKLLVDYGPVMKYQKETAKVNQAEAEMKDLSVYRQIKNRWLTPDKYVLEDVVMKRITGRICVDMGILSDQFDQSNGGAGEDNAYKYPVNRINLVFRNQPTQVYLYDNASNDNDGQVITREAKKEDYIFQYDISRELATSVTEHCRFEVETLPGTLSAEIQVFFEGKSQILTYPLATAEAPVRVKPNTRTSVLFNGFLKDHFEVRYAGFDDDTMVDVPDNGWNGGWEK